MIKIHVMEKTSDLNEQFLSNGSKVIRGIYISIDGKVDKNNPMNKSRYVVGTLNDFSTLLTKNKNRKCSKDYLNGNFAVLYDPLSKESHNNFLSRYVENSIVDGPVIIINEERDLEVTEHKTLGKIALRNVDTIGYSLD